MKRLQKLFAASVLSLTAAYGATAQVSITTWQANGQHTGLNANETTLTPAQVKTPGNFKIISAPQMDGQSFGQPLVVAGIGTNGDDMVFCGTQRDKVYGFDVTPTGTATQTWMTNLVPSGYTYAVPTNVGSGDISDAVGMTATPVIDKASGTIYAVSKVMTSGADGTATATYHHFLWALNLTDGKVKAGPTEIAATFPGATGSDSSGGNITFNPFHEHMRSAMALNNGILYLTFASHSDTTPYHGEIIGYNPSNFSVVKTFITTPYNQAYGGLWMGGASPAFDAQNNLYAVVGNGNYDLTNHNWGESVLKLSTTASGVPMQVDTSSSANWFTPKNWGATNAPGQLNYNDADLGSAGLLMILNQSPSITNGKNLMLVAGKSSTLYVLDRDNLGGFTTNDGPVLQEFVGPLNSQGYYAQSNFATPAYYNGNVYYATDGQQLCHYKVNYDGTNYLTLAEKSKSSETFGNKSCTPFISCASDYSNALLWAQSSGQVLVYDPTNIAAGALLTINLTTPGGVGCNISKFGTITVANGKMYAAASNTSTGNSYSNQSYLFTCALVPPAAGSPNQPTNVAVQALSQSSNLVSWTDNSSGSAQYYIYRSTSATGGFTKLNTTVASGTGTIAYTDTGLTPSTTYYYEVVAFNNTAAANPTSPVGATTFPYYAEPNLVGYWPLEEVGATTTADGTGNGHTGSLVGSECEISAGAGLINNGFHAHGTGAAPSHVLVANKSDMQFTASQSFTLSAWVQADAAARGTEQTVLAKARDSSTGYYGIYLNGNGNFLARGPQGDIVGTTVASSTVWVHVALVQDGAANKRTLYVNGKAEATGTAQDASGAGDLWMLQQNISGSYESLAGDLDEVRLYNRALAAGEITNLMGPPVLEADSVLTHNVSGGTAFPVMVWPTTTQRVEPRQGPSNSYKVVFTAATPLKSGVTSSVGTVSTDSNPRHVIVTLTATNATTTNIKLSNLLSTTEPSGTAAGTVVIPFNVLKGDVNGDGVVNNIDANIVKGNYTAATNAAVAKYDVNLDGTVDATDLSVVTNAAGTSLSGGQSVTDLALYATASSNSVNGNNTPDKAVNSNTTDPNDRWDTLEGTNCPQPSVFMVDLGTACTIQQVILAWQSQVAAASSFSIDASNTGSTSNYLEAPGNNWTTLYSTTSNNAGGVQKYNVSPSGTFRYIRVLCNTRIGNYGFSLYDFEVMGLSGASGGGGGTATAPVVTSNSINVATGGAISYQISATNSPTSYGGSGQSFLSVNASSGAVTGTAPTAANTYQETITATNSAGQGQGTLTINVGTKPAVTSGTPPNGTAGTAYSFTVTATGSATLSYNATGLPGGLSIDASSGKITGTPTAAGTFTPTIAATNAYGSDSKQYTVTIAAAATATAPTITSGTPPGGTVGTAYNFALTASGTTPITWSATGLPAGLSIASGASAITGTPTAAGSSTNVVVTATNSAGNNQQTYSITIAAAASGTNLALSSPATASSSNGGNTPGMAVDGSLTTRWESAQGSDPQWIYVDLGAPATIQQVVLNWENAAGKAYTIDVANDPSNPGTQNASNWTNFATETNNTYSSNDGSNPHPAYTNASLTGTYRYVRVFGTARTTQYGYSLWEFQVIGTGGTTNDSNVALSKTATASSTNGGNTAAMAVDGNTGTRWESVQGTSADPSYIYVDLGAVYTLSKVELLWENAAGADYKIQTATSTTSDKTQDSSWTQQVEITDGTSGQDRTITFPSAVSARYVRMLGISRTTTYGYSIYEFRVFGH